MEFTVTETMLYVIGIAVVVAAALIGWWLTRRRKSHKLKEEFGPEYEHEVQAIGSRSKAEDELKARRERVKNYELQELSAADQERFAERWRNAQQLFVDHPGKAVGDAARLIDEAMERRGYPVGEIQQQEADLSVHYPREVQDYRKAYAIAERNRQGEATTEELREAMVCYRNLFEHLVGLNEHAHTETA